MASASDRPLHGLSDLEEPNPHGVEYERIGQLTPAQVRPDGRECSGNVRESLPVVPAHSGTRSR